jgi:hypothetical protein
MFDRTMFSDPTDPCPEPARRWLRAGYLLAHGRRPMRRDDGATREAWQFRRGLGRCRGAAGRGRPAERFPEMAEAHAAYAAAEPLRRAELEARLLAGEDDAAIAAKMALSPAGVSAYHDVLFEVRPRLAHPHYVLGVVLGGGRVFYAPDPADHGLLLRLLGYQMGGHYVDVLLDYFREPLVLPGSLEGLDEAALRRLLGKLRTQLLLLATTTPAEALPPEEWLRLQGAMAPTPEPAAGADPLASTLAALRAALEAAATLSEAAARGPAGRRYAALGPGRPRGRLRRAPGPR